MTPEEKIQFCQRQIDTRKQEIAQIQGKIDMVKERLAEMGINSKKELEEALARAEKEYVAARQDYESKMSDFESKYGEYFPREI